MYKNVKYYANLIFNSDFCSQGVVRVPLLSEGQAILRTLVFGFQGTDNFAGISVGRTRCFEFLQETFLERRKSFNRHGFKNIT